MPILPTRSTLIHLRLFFSFFLLPVYVFALSQTKDIDLFNAIIVFIVWHLFIYPASNGYNSYFDKDEKSIALLKHPPPTDKSLYYFSLLLDLAGFLLALLVSLEFALATLIFGILSKMYSHPRIRLKKNPILSFLVVFIFQGAFVYWSSYSAISNSSMMACWNREFAVAGIICSCLIGASYPLTQVYQHEEDARRGDKTLSLLLGVKGSFLFSGAVFMIATVLMFWFWEEKQQMQYFWRFLVFILPVMYVFLGWFLKVYQDKKQADFKNMSRMTLTSGALMLIYFLTLLLD